MSKQKPKYRRPLNDKQLLILRVLYKFRFITVDLMCRQRSKSTRDVMYGRLRVLADQKYIAMRYGQTQRKQGLPAIYYLLPDGIRALAKLTELNPDVLHAAYYDRRAGQGFINRCLAIFALYRQFEKLYPGRYKMLTSSETTGHDYYPKLLPHLHLEDTKGDGDYFLDYIDENTTNFTVRRQLTGYVEHFDEGKWEETTGDEYPKILMVYTSPKIERGLQRRVPRLVSGEGLSVYATSLKALLESSSAEEEIWTDVDEPEELICLS